LLQKAFIITMVLPFRYKPLQAAKGGLTLHKNWGIPLCAIPMPCKKAWPKQYLTLNLKPTFGKCFCR